MNLSGVTWRGSGNLDIELLSRLPDELARLLGQINGFVLMGGALHLRGAVAEPEWHSIEHVWTGPRALSRRYSAVDGGDVPFAQGALGDQLLLRDGVVQRLHAETGALEHLGLELFEFLEAVESEPLETLGLEPFLAFYQQGGRLEPGELVMALPPFCSEESEQGVRFKAVSVGERLDFLAGLAATVAAAEPGDRLELKILDA